MKSNRSGKVSFRNILISSGEFTIEGVIKVGNAEYFDNAPKGETVGLKETQNLIKSNNDKLPTVIDGIDNYTQRRFDIELEKCTNSQKKTALSLAFLNFDSEKNNFNKSNLYKYISKNNSTKINKSINLICNIVNGSKHTNNGLAFCEFMIIPRSKITVEKINILSEVYLDLQKIITVELGNEHLYIGREGGFAPNISNVEEAINLMYKAIYKRNKGKCWIAIDVAANNFCVKKDNKFRYTVNNKELSTTGLLNYYEYLIKKYKLIKYFEDPFHEDDIIGWKKLFNKYHTKLLIVADDLVVTKLKNVVRFKGCFNSCILKINQAGSLTELINVYNYCFKNKIKTIISQRSGETDSNTIVHLGVGLGADYIKAGAPARERIVKYNELIRINSKST